MAPAAARSAAALGDRRGPSSLGRRCLREHGALYRRAHGRFGTPLAGPSPADRRRGPASTEALGVEPQLRADPTIEAGLVIDSGGACLDGSLRGLLADRQRLEARLLSRSWLEKPDERSRHHMELAAPCCGRARGGRSCCGRPCGWAEGLIGEIIRVARDESWSRSTRTTRAAAGERDRGRGGPCQCGSDPGCSARSSTACCARSATSARGPT